MTSFTDSSDFATDGTLAGTGGPSFADPPALGTEGVFGALGQRGPGTASSATATASQSLTVGSPLTGLDLAPVSLFAVICHQYPGSWRLPEGWAELDIYSADAMDLRVYYKYAASPQAEPASYTWTTDAAAGNAVGYAWAQPDLDPSQPIDSTGSGVALQQYPANGIELPSEVVLAPTAVLYAVIGLLGSPIPGTGPVPAGMALLSDAARVADQLAASVSWQPWFGSDDTGPRLAAFDSSAAESAGFLFAVTPGPPDQTYLGALGTLAVTGVPIPALANFGATGSLTVAATPDGSFGTDGGLAVQGVVVASAAFSATGGVASAVHGQLALSGGGSLTGLARPQLLGTPIFSGAGSLAGFGTPRSMARVGFSTAGALSGSVRPVIVAQAELSGQGALIATGALRGAAAVLLAGTGRLSGSGHLLTGGSISLTGGGTLLAAGAGMAALQLLAFGGLGELAVIGSPVLGPIGLGLLSATGTLAAVGGRPEQPPVGATVKPAIRWGIDYGS